MSRKSITLGLAAVLTFALLITAMPASAEPVEIGFGSLKIGGIYQGAFTYFEDDMKANEFKLKRARLLLSGTLIPDKVKFFVQADGVGTPFVLDSKLILTVIPNTALTFGRFVPNYSLYMPRSTAKLDFINYPLTTTQYAMWRQTGLQFNTTTEYVDISGGIYNGYQTEEGSSALKGNDWGDNNDAKDYLGRIDIKPMKNLKIGLFGWMGSPYDFSTDEDYDATRYGANVELYIEGLHLAAEYVAASTDISGTSDSIDGNAFFAQASYAINDSFEVLGRYDHADSNTDVDDNAVTWMTAGINYSLEKWYTKFFLNYVMKDEEGKEVDNDEVIFMAQYSF